MGTNPGRKYVKRQGELLISQCKERIVIIPGSGGCTSIPGYLIDALHSFDGTKAAILVGRNKYGMNEEGNMYEGGTLYLITDRPARLADGVYSLGTSQSMSRSGDCLVFTKDVRGQTGKLCRYSDGQITTIHSEYPIDGHFILSPDGETVGYSVIDIDGDKAVTGYIYDGEERVLGRDAVPCFVAGGAEYIYYQQGEHLYVQKGLDQETKVDLGAGTCITSANIDLSQVVCTRSKQSFLCRNGEKKEMLAGEAIYFLKPAGTAFSFPIYGVSTFADTYYCDGEQTIRHIDKHFRTGISIVKNTRYPQIADDGKTITYAQGRSVKQIVCSVKYRESVELARGKAASFLALDDSKAICYTNENNELFFQRGTEKPVLLSQEVEKFAIGLKNNKTIVYISGGELYESDGTTGSWVNGFGEAVWNVSADAFGVTVDTEDKEHYYSYYSRDGRIFHLIAECCR